MIATILANAHRDRKARRRPFALEDFMPQHGVKPRERQSPEEMLRLVQVMNAALGGADEPN